MLHARCASFFAYPCSGAEPPDLRLLLPTCPDTLHWENNTAPYGAIYATQPVSVVVPASYVVDVYEGTLSPSIVVELRDFYGALVVR